MIDPVEVLIVDDDEKESSLLAELLNECGSELNCVAIQPSKDITLTVSAVRKALTGDGPRLLLLDYRLEDHDLPDGGRVEFKGGTVAGYLRDEDPDLPIVLLTSEEKLHDFVERRPGMKQQFEYTVIKRKVAEDGGAAHVQAELADFATTWHSARGWRDDPDETWTSIGALMDASAEGLALFSTLEAEPPRGDVAGDVMHWLLKRAHRFQGPLIGQATVRVALGVTEESFESSELQRWLDPARYTGALGAFGTRWWAHIVRARIGEACGGFRRVEASARAAALSEVVGVGLESEPCSWCDGERTLHACMVCRRATDAAHCLTPLGEPLPAWADAPVACFRCVAEGRAEKLRFAPASQEIVAGLIEDRIRPPE